MPDDGKVVRKLVNSNITSSRIFWKVIWKHLLSHKIIGTLWPNGHTKSSMSKDARTTKKNLKTYMVWKQFSKL